MTTTNYRNTGLAALALVTAAALSGCGGDTATPAQDGSSEPTPSQSASTTEPIHLDPWDAPGAPTFEATVEVPEQPNYVYGLDFAPDGTSFASGDADGTVKIWGADGTEQQELTGHEGAVNDVAFSPDGTHLASAGADKTVRVWDVATGDSVVVEGATDEVRAVAFTPDGTSVVAGSWDDNVRFYDVTGGAPTDTIKSGDGVESLELSPDGSVLAVGGTGGDLELWSGPEWTRDVANDGSGASIGDLAFSPDGQTLYGGTNDSTVIAWSATDGSVEKTLKGWTNYVVSVAVSPDGTLLAAGSLNGIVRVYGTDTFKTAGEQQNMGGVNALDFSPAEPFLLTGDGQAITGYTLR